MSVNKNRPHILVLPEDDANRQLATGFQLALDFARHRQMQVLPVAGGWLEVLDRFQKEHVGDMVRFSERHVVLLIDFDGREDRLEHVRSQIPTEVSDRVFILGVWSEPERLKEAGLGGYEAIGSRLANDCQEENEATWSHELLRHNAGELQRLNQQVRPILF